MSWFSDLAGTLATSFRVGKATISSASVATPQTFTLPAAGGAIAVGSFEPAQTAVSQGEAELGTEAALRSWSPVRVSLAAAKFGVPTGTLIWFAASTAPANFLKASGAAISRTTYAALFAVIGTTYGVGDNSTTFNVPDLRGEFVRGWDDARGIDSGRAIGTWQGSSNLSHSHSTSIRYNASGGGSGYTALCIIDNIYGYAEFPTDAVGGTEARPRNIALLACIKY